ncbi:helix-turn-helix domain-containing protein [Humibacter antri]
MAAGTFDSDAFYAALNQTRQSRNLNWKQVAAESGVSASTLTRMAQGRRPDIDGLAALTVWSGLSSDDYVRRESTEPAPETMAMISTYLRADKHLTPKAAEAMESVIKSTYEAMRSSKADE